METKKENRTPKPYLTIEPKKSIFQMDWAEIYAYRELLWTLTYRDLRVRYAQTAIGVLWAVLNPLFTLFILAFVFGVVAKVELGTTADGQPIPQLLYTVAGMAGWTYFATLLSEAGTSIIGAQGMVKKIYFPRLIIPLSKAFTAFIDFAIVLIFMAIMMIYYGFSPSANIIYFPFFFLMAVIAGLAGGIWMSALTIRFRDFMHITPFILRLGMYATPIAYPASSVPEKYQIFFYLNPLTGIVEGMRWSLLGGTPIHQYAYISFAIIAVFCVLGLFYFKKVERVMADIL
jgi:lipopolysaccharide transport system permease protein